MNDTSSWLNGLKFFWRGIGILGGYVVLDVYFICVEKDTLEDSNLRFEI